MDTPTKRCTKCGQEFPATLEFFYKWSYSCDGLTGQCKSCARERVNQWRKNNPQKAKEMAHRSRQNNKEKIAKRQKRYNETHREQAAERSHRWNERNPGKANERARQWYQDHREYVISKTQQHYRDNREKILNSRQAYNEAHRNDAKKRAKEWVKNHPWKTRASRIRRRARIRNAPGSHTAADIKLQYTSQKGLCWWCGRELDTTFHVDHRVPLIRGGSNAPENLVISCAKCNLSKHDKLPSEFNGRLL